MATGGGLTRHHPSIDNFTPCAQPPRIRENPSSAAEGLEKCFVTFWEREQYPTHSILLTVLLDETQQEKQVNPMKIAKIAELVNHEAN